MKWRRRDRLWIRCQCQTGHNIEHIGVNADKAEEVRSGRSTCVGLLGLLD